MCGAFRPTLKWTHPTKLWLSDARISTRSLMTITQRYKRKNTQHGIFTIYGTFVKPVVWYSQDHLFPWSTHIRVFPNLLKLFNLFCQNYICISAAMFLHAHCILEWWYAMVAVHIAAPCQARQNNCKLLLASTKRSPNAKLLWMLFSIKGE